MLRIEASGPQGLRKVQVEGFGEACHPHVAI